MLKFEYKDIVIEARAELQRYDYKDANNIGRTRFDKSVLIKVQFWHFVIYNDLYDFSVIKSALQYFMQAYWKRSSKQGGKIDLSTSIEHNDTNKVLQFVARQSKHKYSLEVSLYEQGDNLSANMYLTGQEVIMLDVALTKAINLLVPEVHYPINKSL